MIVKTIGGPVQVTPLLVKDAVTVKVAVRGPLVLFIPKKEGINPVPNAGDKPMLGPQVCIQLIVAPGAELLNTIEGTRVWKQ